MQAEYIYIVDDIKLYCNRVRYVIGGVIASRTFIIQHRALQIIISGNDKSLT